MNLPNKLTMLRIFMVPVMVAFLLLGLGETGDYVATALFIAASLTDLADGYIARKYHMVTNFGKFMDPLADKLLVCSAVICLIEMGRIPSWAVLILIGREFIISGFRLVAADKGIVIAASYWGKFKTTFQMAMTVAMMLHFDLPWWRLAEQVLLWIALALTIISLADYMIKNAGVLRDEG